MEYEVVPCHGDGGCWRVEPINYDGDGECYVAYFVGPVSEQRAREYAAWKGSQ